MVELPHSKALKSKALESDCLKSNLVSTIYYECDLGLVTKASLFVSFLISKIVNIFFPKSKHGDGQREEGD